jgi:hypothetical protein
MVAATGGGGGATHGYRGPLAAQAASGSIGKAHAARWKLAFSFRFSEHPLNPDSGATCATGRRSRVWFLGGVFNQSGRITRDYTVPAGTRLVVAVVNVECSTLEAPPFYGDDRASLRRCARGVARPKDPFSIKQRFAILDGRRLRVRRAPSRVFRFSVQSATDSILSCPMEGCSETRGRAAADGYVLPLRPRSPGRHRLRFGGSVPNLDFSFPIIDRITVAPHAT